AKTTSPSLIEVILAHDTNTARVLKDSNTIQSMDHLRADNADLREALSEITRIAYDNNPFHTTFGMIRLAKKALGENHEQN
ncbi:MAG: hypothetical protein JKY45_00230, partial [Emcibacter sp.]|nr:hypothetical protein [Emcibacter sp.]